MVVVVDTVSAIPLRPRHPEKVKRPDALSPPKPDWIRVRAPNTRGYADTSAIVSIALVIHDLADGGGEHFAQTIRAIRARCPATTIEILTPDFLRKDGAL